MTGTGIRGVGMHPFGRHTELDLRDIAARAINEALDDAGIGPREVGAAFFANSYAGLLNGQESIRGQTVLQHAGIHSIPITNVENACASGSTALWMAIRSVAFGDARYAIAVGAEKMVVGDLGRVLSALQNSSDTAVTQGLGVQFVSIYAMRLQDALDRGIITRGHLARVTVKNQHNGSLNPYAQYGAEMTEREVLEARAIAGPFTLPMVAGISDGAAAVVVANEGDETRVRILASALTSGASEALDEAASVRAVRTAYEQAGVGPEDLDVAEVHDAVSGSELLYYEQLGLCAAEDIGDFLDSGASALGGSSPVNPSGGLTARGHPVGATGLAQVAELTWQITGRAGGRQVESASIGLSQNSGGWLAGDSAASAVHILGAN